MEIEAIFKLMLAAIFSPPGIANFVISTILKKRLHATAAALLSASAFVFMNKGFFTMLPTTNYMVSIIAVVIGMMIVSHLAFTIGEKLIRNKK